MNALLNLLLLFACVCVCVCVFVGFLYLLLLLINQSINYYNLFTIRSGQVRVFNVYIHSKLL